MSDGKAPSRAAGGTAGDDCKLAPAEGWSPQELERQSALPRSLPAPDLPAKPRQFSVSDVMIVMIGVALGLAGGSWMPRDMFAAVLGLVTLAPCPGWLILTFLPDKNSPRE